MTNQEDKSNLTNHLFTVVSLGDPAGIGREVIHNIIKNKNILFNSKELLMLQNAIFVGDLYISDKKINQLYNVLPFPEYKNTEDLLKIIESATGTSNKPVYFFLDKQTTVHYGKPSISLAKRSVAYLQKALQICKDLPFSALVTLPLSKEYIIKSGLKFSGHTEFLQNFWKKKTYMLMYHKSLSVLPLTTHIPIADVSRKIKEINFKDLANALLFFKRNLADNKPVALMGLNPHAGENGKIGNEENYLKKQMKIIENTGIKIDGPFAADGFFSTEQRKGYSIAIVNYHDQGLIPFKMLAKFDGINITLNLPKIRISPAHGTAYSIAGKNKANIKSILQSLKFAFKWGKKWIQYSSFRQSCG